MRVEINQMSNFLKSGCAAIALISAFSGDVVGSSQEELNYNAAMSRVANRAPLKGDDQLIKDYIATLGKGVKGLMGAPVANIAKIGPKELAAQNPYYQARVKEKLETERLLMPVYEQCSAMFAGEQDPAELVNRLKSAKITIDKYAVDGPRLEKELEEAKALLGFHTAKDFDARRKAYHSLRQASKPAFAETDLDQTITGLSEEYCKLIMLDLDESYNKSDAEAKQDLMKLAVDYRAEDLDHLWGIVATLSEDDPRYGKELKSYITSKGLKYQDPADFDSEIKEYGDLLKSKGAKAFHKATWRKPEEIKDDAWKQFLVELTNNIPKPCTNELSEVVALGAPELRKILRLSKTDAEIGVLLAGAKVPGKILDKLAPEAKKILDAAGAEGYDDLVNILVDSQLVTLDDYAKLSAFLNTTHGVKLAETGDHEDDLRTDVQRARGLIESQVTEPKG